MSAHDSRETIGHVDLPLPVVSQFPGEEPNSVGSGICVEDERSVIRRCERRVQDGVRWWRRSAEIIERVERMPGGVAVIETDLVGCPGTEGLVAAESQKLRTVLKV